MDCWGVMCKEFRKKDQAEQGLRKSHVAVEQYEDSAIEIKYGVCKAAPLSG